MKSKASFFYYTVLIFQVAIVVFVSFWALRLQLS